MGRQNFTASIVGLVWGALYAIGRAIAISVASANPIMYREKPKAMAELPALEQAAIMLAVVLVAICIAIVVESDRFTYWTVDAEAKENPNNPAIPAYLFLCSLARPFWLAQLVVEAVRLYKGQANAVSAGIWIGVAVLSLAFLSLERRRARIRIRHWRISVYVVPEQDDTSDPASARQKAETTALEPMPKSAITKPAGK